MKKTENHNKQNLTIWLNSLLMFVTATTLGLGVSSTRGAVDIPSITMSAFDYALVDKDITIGRLRMQDFSTIEFGRNINGYIYDIRDNGIRGNGIYSEIILDGGTLYLGCDVEDEEEFGRYFSGSIREKDLSEKFFSHLNLSSVAKIGNNTVILSGDSTYCGGTTISGGILQTENFRALGLGDVRLSSGTLRVGDEEKKIASVLFVGGNWESDRKSSDDKGGRVQLVVDSFGWCSSIDIAGKVTGITALELVGETGDINQLGAKLVAANAYMSCVNTNLIMNLDENGNAPPPFLFYLVDKNCNPYPLFYNEKHGTWLQGFETSRYCFSFFRATDIEGNYGFGVNNTMGWGLMAQNQDVIVPDLSTMVLTSIIGFEIPRAQHVNGPWVRMRGGQLNDGKAMFNKNSYQSLMVGWDKTFDKKGCGSWNLGMFFEGDWLYGNGDWKSNWETIQGRLNSQTSGIGAGLYASRSLESGFYVDAIGRLNVFENKVHMNTHSVWLNDRMYEYDPANNYRGQWSSSLFSLALEFGKDYTSRNERWTFNPYNRLIYTSAPSQQFDVIFGDDSIVNINNRSVDAWTNKLGARLAYKSSPQCQQHSSKTFYVGADYYQGLSGRFMTETLDTLNPNDVKTNHWRAVDSNRPKNDLAYGTTSVGMTVQPKEWFLLNTQADILFGEVDGWSLSLSGKFTF